MKGRLTAKRYGRAIFELAIESGEAASIVGDLTRIAKAARSVPEMMPALSDERVEAAHRVRAANDICKALSVGKVTRDLVNLLISRRRIGLLELIADDCEARLEHYSKIARAGIRVASADEAGEAKKSVEQTIQTALGLKSHCDVKIDPDLIGGFAVKIGDMVYDASISGRIERMREAASANGNPRR